MIILKRQNNYYLEHNGMLYPLETAYKANLISQTLAEEIVAVVAKLSEESGEDKAMYVEVYLQEKAEKEKALANENMRKQYEILWQYPDISALPLETLEKIAKKSLGYLHGMDIAYNVYARYRDKQRSNDKLFRDASNYVDLASSFNETCSNLESAIDSQKKDSILKALESFRNYAREVYIFAKSFDTVAYDYGYIAKAMGLDLQFVISCVKENNSSPKDGQKEGSKEAPKENNPAPVVFSNLSLIDSKAPEKADVNAEEEATNAKTKQAAKNSGAKI